MQTAQPRLTLPGKAVLAACMVFAVVLSGCGKESAESLIGKARTQLEKGDTKAGSIYLKQALQADPAAVEARFLLGQALIGMGDPVGATVELTRVLKENLDRDRVLPELARAMLLSDAAKSLTTLYGNENLKSKDAQAMFKTHMATAWASLGDPAKASAAVDAALQAVPDHAQALVLRARAMAAAGGPDAALKIVDEVLARDVKRHEAWMLKGEILALSKADTAAAEEAWRKALAIDKAFVPAHAALIGARINARDLPGATAAVEALRAVLPNHAQTVFAEAYISAMSGKLERAREQTQQVLRVLPEHTSVLQFAGAIEAELGSHIIAESLFAKALSIDPTLARARLGLARSQLSQGKAARAWATIKPAIGDDSRDAQALAVAGEAALAMGDSRSAEAAFNRAAKLEPGNERTGTALALATLARGSSTEAFTQLRALSAASPDTYADMALVSAHIKRAEYDNALAAVEAIARKQPKAAMPHELRGRVLAAKGDLTGARQAFERALQLDPQAFSAMLSLNELDLLEQKHDQAKARMERVIEDQPRNVNARTALGQILERSGAPIADVRRVLVEAIKVAPADAAPRLQLIDANLRAKQVTEALAAAQSATASLPENTEILEALGRAQALAGDNQQALGTFQRIANLDGESARPHVFLAAMYRKQGSFTAAIASLRRAIEIDPNQAVARAELVDLLMKGNRTKQAIELAREMQTRAPDEANGYLLEGAILMRAKDLPGAIAVYRGSMKRVHGPDELARQLHRALVAAGRADEAKGFASEWIKAHPDDAAMHFEISDAALARRDLEAAEKHLRMVVAGRPDHVVALNNLAWVLAARGKPGAVLLARRAVALQPDQPRLMDTLAAALAAENQLPEALKVQQQAIDIAPGEMGLRLNLAKLALKAGDKALARSELDRMAAAGPKSPFSAEVAALLKQL